MTQFSIEQLQSNPLADSANTLANIASGARNAVCDVYRSSPGFITSPDASSPGLGGDLGEAYRQMLDSLCGDRPLPPAPPKLSGGQCAIPYTVGWETKGPGPLGTVTTNNQTDILQGPIRGMQFIPSVGGAPFAEYAIVHGANSTRRIVLGFSTNIPRYEVHRATITSITALNPELDVCGDTPNPFPSLPSTPDSYNPPTTYRDRGVDVDVTVNIPPIVIPPGAISITPKLEVKVGPNKVVFDGSGARLELSPELNIPITIGGGTTTPNPNAPVTVAPEIDGELLADRFDRIEDILEDIQKCACDDDGIGPLVTTVGNRAPSQCVSISVGRNKFCAIALSDQPINRKIQSGGSAPDVIYAGWAWFKAGDYLFERSPIDSQGKLFKNPGGAEAFCYTLYSGFNGTPIILDEPIPPA